MEQLKEKYADAVEDLLCLADRLTNPGELTSQFLIDLVEEISECVDDIDPFDWTKMETREYFLALEGSLGNINDAFHFRDKMEEQEMDGVLRKVARMNSIIADLQKSKLKNQ